MNPDTTLIDGVIASFALVEGLENCPLIVVGDGVRLIEDLYEKESAQEVRHAEQDAFDPEAAARRDRVRKKRREQRAKKSLLNGTAALAGRLQQAAALAGRATPRSLRMVAGGSPRDEEDFAEEGSPREDVGEKPESGADKSEDVASITTQDNLRNRDLRVIWKRGRITREDNSKYHQYMENLREKYEGGPSSTSSTRTSGGGRSFSSSSPRRLELQQETTSLTPTSSCQFDSSDVERPPRPGAPPPLTATPAGDSPAGVAVFGGGAPGRGELELAAPAAGGALEALLGLRRPTKIIGPLPKHLSFAHTLLHGLEQVRTEYVMVVQHDRAFIEPTSVVDIVRYFDRLPSLRYVGFQSRSCLNYPNKLRGKYGEWANVYNLQRGDEMLDEHRQQEDGRREDTQKARAAPGMVNEEDADERGSCVSTQNKASRVLDEPVEDPLYANKDLKNRLIPLCYW